jgi:hypothetical protein
VWVDDIPTFIAALAPARLALWPALGAAGAALVAGFREGRRRTVLNEHLHEVRRPLQALALMAPRQSGGSEGGEGPVEMAAAALARLEREINGERRPGARAPVAVRPLLEAARRRWCGQATLVGASLALRWDADEAAVEGDRIDLAAALDNLGVRLFRPDPARRSPRPKRRRAMTFTTKKTPVVAGAKSSSPWSELEVAA